MIAAAKTLKPKHGLASDLRKHALIYFLFLPVLAYYIIFCYWPMYGVQIAFKNYVPAKGVLNSSWVGLKHFLAFFKGMYFTRLLRNTLLISVYSLVFGFPAPIIFALLINELRSRRFKRFVQTATYLPHFLSTVVICGMIIDFTNSKGIISQLLSVFGMPPRTLLLFPQNFRTIYVASGIWQGVGWGSIIYLAALSGIDPTYYEAACVDGAGRLRQAIHVTLPGIAPTITVLLILQCGGLLSVGYEKIILLYNNNTLETADVISSYVYRRGLLELNYSFSAAVGLFNSVANLLILVITNTVSRRISESSLW
ncbi:sugar ABC transporter permease [Clostridia bacterium]|nr:sugar ABC transporter permease [Clostridia bacterium]